MSGCLARGTRVGVRGVAEAPLHAIAMRRAGSVPTEARSPIVLGALRSRYDSANTA